MTIFLLYLLSTFSLILSQPVNVSDTDTLFCYARNSPSDPLKVIQCGEKDNCCLGFVVAKLEYNTTMEPSFATCWAGPNCTPDCKHEYNNNRNVSVCQCNTSFCNKHLIYQEQDPTDSPNVSTTPAPTTSHTTIWVVVGVAIFFLVVLGVLIFILRGRIVRHFKMVCSNGERLDEFSGGDMPLLPKFPNGKAMGPQYEGHAELEIIRDIGYGRYGQVQQARVGDTFVAVKKFSPSDRNSFINELMIMTEKKDVYLLCLLGYIHNDPVGQLWIISEYMPLGNLSDYLRQHTLTVRQCLHILSTFISGLCFLHSEPQPVAHRDIKSRNILMADHKTAKLADFGLALLLDSGPGGALNDKAAPPTQVGTARYMAPEVLEGSMFYREAEAHMRIDVYASSLVMWEIMWRTQLSTTDQVEQYMLPFERLIPGHPTPCDMQGIVVTEKRRPELRKSWVNDPIFSKLEVTLTESWDNDENARLSSKTIQARVLPLLSTENDSEVSV